MSSLKSLDAQTYDAYLVGCTTRVNTLTDLLKSHIRSDIADEFMSIRRVLTALNSDTLWTVDEQDLLQLRIGMESALFAGERYPHLIEELDMDSFLAALKALVPYTEHLTE